MTTTGRKLAIAAVSLGLLCSIAPPAGADNKDKKQERSFWEWLLEPHAQEVSLVVGKVDTALNQLPMFLTRRHEGRVDASGVKNRNRLLDDTAAMIRYAIKLAPDRVSLYRRLGVIDAERGKVKSAVKSLEHYLAREVPRRIDATARLQLGTSYARMENWNEAVEQLRLGISSMYIQSQAAKVRATFTLANVYMHTQRLSEAVELLRNTTVNQNMGWQQNWTLKFALAVAYDRDEQLSLAHKTLDRMIALDPNVIATALDPTDSSSPLLFTPIFDRHYYAGLQFEALGKLEEARTEWQAYVRIKEAPYRARAKEHVRRIDELLEEEMKSGKKLVDKVKP